MAEQAAQTQQELQLAREGLEVERAKHDEAAAAAEKQRQQAREALDDDRHRLAADTAAAKGEAVKGPRGPGV